MRVVLREDVDNLGRKGDLLDVADGYARNFLVPRGLAIKATRGVVQQAEAMRRNREVREVRDRSHATELAQRLSTTRIEVKARAGEGGKLFGSVTSGDIAEAVLAQTEVAQRLATTRIEVKARAGEGGRLFGSVTSGDIAEAVLAQTEVELDRRKISLAEPLKELGTVEVPVQLHTDVEATLTIEVVAS